jgi:TonB family protein
MMDLWSSLSVGVSLIGWALLHFVWQGLLVGVIYFLGRSVLFRGESRYRWGMAALAVLAACPFLTIASMLRTPTSLHPAEATMGAVLTFGTSGGFSSDGRWIDHLDVLLPWLVLLWSLGLLLLSLRAFRQWLNLRRLVRDAEALPAWNDRVARLAERFKLRRNVDVLCSKLITTPALVGGLLRPVILLPVAVVCRFPASQIELILSHEMAHLRRWDPLANFLQVVLETLFFYHPVVRWISNDVRNEREICCDAMALEIGGGSRREFVSMLADLGDLQEEQSRLMLAVTGGALLDRVQQVLSLRQQVPGSRAPVRFAVAMLGVLLIGFALQIEWKESRLQRSLDESMLGLRALVVSPWNIPVMPHFQWAAPKLTYAPSIALPVAEGLAQIPASPEVAGLGGVIAGAATVPPLHLSVENLVGTMEPSALRISLPSPAVVPVQAAVLVTPTALRVRQPTYPAAALSAGIEGRVTLEFGLGGGGSVQSLQVVSASPAGVFDRAAVAAMRDWTYQVPADASAAQRYRQTLVFALTGSNARQANDVARRPRIGCDASTGTHICHNGRQSAD